MKKKIAYAVFTLGLLALTAYLSIDNSYLEYRTFLGLRFVLLSLAIWSSAVFFNDSVVKNKTLSEARKNRYTLAFSSFSILLLLELVFTFIPKAHGVGHTYAARNWNTYYLRTNTLGFRDEALDTKDFSKPLLLFLGDSFTEGAGIKSPADRFPNLVCEKLSGQYEFMIVGKSGDNLINQLQHLKKLEQKPEVIVYQYYGNDIEGDAQLAGLQSPPIAWYSDLTMPGKLAVKSSYLLNYLYWSFPRPYLNAYFDYIKSLYQDDKIFQSHAQSLRELVEYCEVHDIKIYTLLLPFLNEIEQSKGLYLDKVLTALESSNSPQFQDIPLLSQIEAIPVKERVVNCSDAHASKLVHEIIAEEILRAVTN